MSNFWYNTERIRVNVKRFENLHFNDPLKVFSIS